VNDELRLVVEPFDRTVVDLHAMKKATEQAASAKSRS
jgi:hypothetical protein